MAGTIIDLALVAIMLIALAVGAIRGFMKQLTGLMSRMFSVVLAVILSGLVMNALKSTDLFASFCNSAADWFKGNVYTAKVFSQEQLANVLQSSEGWHALLALAPTLYTEMTALGITTFGQLLGHYAASAIAYAVLWLLIFILVKIAIKIVGSILQKFARLPVLSTINRILGACWSAGFVYILFITLLLTGIEVFVYKYINSSWNALCDFIKQSKLLTFANNTNYLGMLLAKYANVVLPKL